MIMTMNQHKRKHNTPQERINRVIVALYEIKEQSAKCGRLAGMNTAFKKQNVAVMTREILFDLPTRDITPEYAEELIERDGQYRRQKYEQMMERARERTEGRLDSGAASDAPTETPAECTETPADATQSERVDNCPPVVETPAERDIFDLDEQACIDFLKSKGWHFAECHIATKWV